MSQNDPGTMMHRIVQLEGQVKGLMETVSQLHKMYGLDALNIPKPDQYVGGAEHSTPDNIKPEPTADPEPNSTPVSKEQAPISASEEEEQEEEEDVSDLEPYEYSPLDSDASEIRILALQASQSLTGPITCRLVTTSLEDVDDDDDYFNPPPTKLFTPLSYCWGTTSMTENIILDGRQFLVTPTVHSALMHFRKVNQNLPDDSVRGKNTSETFWWIDAICVNQEDLDERGSQVALMSRLYRQAPMVHVWLGEESEDSARAMQAIRELAYLPTSPEEWDSWEYLAKPGKKHRPAGPGRPLVELPAEPSPVPAEEKAQNYSALINLYQRPWFSRAWIRQEVALPEGIKFHCGTETCSWEEVMRTADMLTYLADEYHLPDLQRPEIRESRTFTSCFQRVTELSKLRSLVGGNNENYGELQSLIFDYRDCQATDARDKIYAILPLINPDETEVAADYRKDHLDVYKDVTLSLIKDSLNYLGGCQNPSRSNGLPSWVPNLKLSWNPLPLAPDYGHDKSLENTWGNDEDDPPRFEYVPQQSRLDVRGVIFDAVRAIDLDSIVGIESSNQDVRATVTNWWEFYREQKELLFNLWEMENEEGYWEKRTQCQDMFDASINQEDWESRTLQNLDGDQYRDSGDATGFKPMDGRPIDLDPTFKRIKRLLLLDDTSYADEMGEDQYFAALRPLAVGRRMLITSKGASGLVPADAEPDDQICFFSGSSCPFVIRRAGDNTWVIVGQAYYFGRITLYQAQPPLSETTIRLV